jgi:dolichol-phosphate mannosyltransferase
LVTQKSQWNFTVSAIIPVWRDTSALVYDVLARFDKPYVDEIILVVDEPEPRLRSAILLGRSIAIPPVTVIENERRMGIGYAIRLGLKYSMRKSYDVAVVMAGNGKDDPKEIPRLLKEIENGYDYVQGSRFLPGGKHEKTPIIRGVFIRLWPYAWTMFTSQRCTEVTNGFRAYRTRLIKDHRINIDQHWLNHYALEYYLHYYALKLGYRFTEVPISKIYLFRNRGGYSKIRPHKDWIHIVMPLILLKSGARR